LKYSGNTVEIRRDAMLSAKRKAKSAKLKVSAKRKSEMKRKISQKMKKKLIKIPK